MELSQGHRLPDFIHGMDAALAAVSSSLASDAKPPSKQDLANIAKTAAGDARLAAVIVGAFEGAEKDGLITITTGDVTDPKLDLLEGLRFDRGYLSEMFVNSPDTRESASSRTVDFSFEAQGHTPVCSGQGSRQR